ncbi:hypothetical protein [Streptomyces rhizosphaerihabitans]|uniref:hypothetical protein n=1 Tax=Streptomyces rhizosphaerihabitans TaxID=1266770 RepID=UPI0021C0051B|nr:hypothetical protein [Streptomyces rhizosphaerihabitans]MCT9003583.1 hypothetical protein [Streptomyces rhizosphaerihabitans]
MPQVPDLPDLSDQTTHVYQQILEGNCVPAETPGLAELLTTGLVVASPHGNNTYTAIDPRYPTGEMIRQLNSLVEQLSAFTGALPEFLTTVHDQYMSTRPPHESVQRLRGRQLVNEHISREHTNARTEIISAQPGNRTPKDLAFSYERDRGALQQGLSMRTLYHSSVRRVATVGEWANAMTTAGGEIRTFNGRFPRAIIFDRRVAFIPVHTVPETPPHDAVMISDPLVVAYAVAIFDLFWERADSWFGSSHGDDKDSATSATQRAILRELCLGRTQSQAAKNLGIGPAWINEQLGQLRKKLGARTLNEVIYWWATSPDHNLQD